ncbi:hypothetical protein FOXG_11032 [Fusarium oxysporum f. sp. lycopersici 4287]|uniref:Uncharacterized protein n=2 Tax=Fusarium oxysporum TaxID=5507 RepID=A0A0J9VI62_FUSO4|nr:hypothetical protein FOXG_11032 [Fusarium oxysporum f. sp. lycopersici 4287]KAJ9429641.1 hypothetical protein QL093DRAFT_2092828 [Fusarium oxysporum]KNB10949.1 hypothetical protein FOXG_11032 [Fusarium oxysporum f. sp. lycopersici 4287]
MAPGRRSRDTSGRFAASDDAFSYHTGKVKVKIGQSARNALGAAENVLRLAELVKKLLDNEITTEPSQEAKSILTTMGDIKGLTASVTAMKAEQVPLPSNHLGSALRVIHRSGGSTRNVVHWFNGSLSGGPSDAFNNIYCPIPNTGVMKFLDTDITPDLRQKAETILKTMGGIQGLTMSVAAIVAEQAPEPASDQFGSAVRVIHDSGGSGSARGTSELFNDSPTPTDIINFPSARKRRATETTEPDSDEDLLAQFDKPADQPQNALTVARPWPAMPYIIADSIAIGNGRRAIYSLIAADELMVSLSEDTAQIFGHLLLILRNKVSQSLPLSAATRMAGISKSLVPVFDMPLYLPNPDSTALASYISSIADMRVFNNLADARTLTRETANFMKSQDWQPSAGLAMQYNRIITPGEGFFPMQVIADKLTHLGQSWKPLITKQGRN